jgi:hypothetical protein
MSIGGGASSGNSQTQLDPEIKGDWRDLYATAKQTAGQPTPQQGVAPLTDTQRLAQSLVLSNAHAGTGTINAAASEAAAAGRTDIPNLAELSVNRTPIDINGAAPLTQAAQIDRSNVPMISAPTMTAAQIDPSSVPMIAAGKMTAAQIDPSSVGKVSADTFPGSNIGAYTSPYLKQVFDTSLNELDTARKRAINGNTDTANAQGGEGAWNGSRAGVSDALTNEAFSKQAAQLAASLNQGGYDTAAQLQQADANRRLAAAQGNQSTDLSQAGTNAGFRQQASATDVANDLAAAGKNQDTGLGIAGTNAGFRQQAGTTGVASSLTAQQANQGVGLNIENTNAGLRQDTGQFNSNLTNSREVFDTNNANVIAAANADRNLKAQEDNLQGSLAKAGLGMTSAQLLAAIAPTQQNMALTGDQAIGTVGQQQQDQAQKLLDTGYTNQMNARNLPLQTLESAFGIIPSTGSGSVTHSSGKSGNAGI